ncbi:hypothetical protein MUN89_06960 [Halobacillus salinarum]|uniref:Uncharacterized protein n=1 Tax=Halobacillus salinarum TaxID=2932257 RepID=A0ABY4EMI4_9BACI|nr:hypothetical protein [Halobacillus salinarum]UOQ45668.1 hypothetical protein MUN89_06960 [Halobacillus salinarum]
MDQSARSLIPLEKIWLDGISTRFAHAFVERLAYEWMVEIVNPFPIPVIDEKDVVLQISFEQNDGTVYSSINLESYEVEEGTELTVYRFFMYQPDG